MRTHSIKDDDLGTRLEADVDPDTGRVEQLRLLDLVDGDVLLTVTAPNGAGVTLERLRTAETFLAEAANLATGRVDPPPSPAEPRSVRPAAAATRKAATSPVRRPVKTAGKAKRAAPTKTNTGGANNRGANNRVRPDDDVLVVQVAGLDGTDGDKARALRDRYGVSVQAARSWVARANKLMREPAG